MHPDKGYRNSHLWLPKSKAKNLQGLKAVLTFEREGHTPLFAWEETDTHLVVPREFIPPEKWDDLSFEMVDRVSWDFPKTEFYATSTLREPIQTLAFAAMMESGSGIVSLACGLGKTVLALHASAATGMQTMIVVNTEDLAHQWKTRILEHTDIDEEDIGWIQGSKWDWDGKPICIAMIQTLASKASDFPTEITEQYGVVIYDEVHILGAPFFNQTADMFAGLRWGLSATWERSDGMEKLYQYHMGEILYEHLEHDIIPTIFFMKTGVTFPQKVHEMRQFRDRTGELSIPKIHTWLAKHEGRNRFLMEQIDAAMQEDRKILVLGERVNQLELFHAHYEGSGLIHSGVKGKDRESQLQDHDLVFAIAQLAKQGLDRKDLDTMIITLPFSDGGRFRQIMGRIQRRFDGKNPPFVIILEDENIPTHKNMCRKLRSHLNALGYPYHIVGN
jgi:superfamily II DNA or RNA helicase